MSAQDRIKAGKGRSAIDRRRLLKLAAGSAIAAPFVLRGTAYAASPLVVANWGGSVAENKAKAYYAPFTQETGIPVTQVNGPDFAKMRTQVREGDVEWDVVDIFAAWLPSGQEIDLYEKLDNSLFDRNAIVPGARSDYAMGTGVFAGGIAFAPTRQGAAKPAPATWSEFWDVAKFPGRRGLLKYIPELLEISLLADGVAPADVYPCDVERAFKSLEKLKPHVTLWLGQPAQSITMVASNELDYSYAYAHRVMDGQNAKQDVDIKHSNQICGLNQTVVLKGTKNRDAAMKFVAFCMRPEQQVKYANLTGVAPVYPAARDKVDEKMRPWLPDPTRPDSLMLDSAWWAGKEAEITTRFNEFLLR